MTAEDLITAAVALDDLEWFRFEFQAGRAPKDELAGVLEDCFNRVLLGCGLTSPEEISHALSRLAELTARLVNVPTDVRSIAAWQSLQMEEERRTPLDPRVRELAEVASIAEARARIDDYKAVAEAVAERRRRWRSKFREDVELEQRVLEPFLRIVSDWFERRDWSGRRIPKSGAYSVLDAPTAAAGPQAWATFIEPALRAIRDTTHDPELRYAAGTCIEEHHELFAG